MANQRPVLPEEQQQTLLRDCPRLGVDVVTPGPGEDPLHQAGDLGLETLQDVQPGGEQGAGQEGGQGVVKPLDQAPDISRPIRGQYSSYVTFLDQSEASIQVT